MEAKMDVTRVILLFALFAISGNYAFGQHNIENNLKVHTGQCDPVSHTAEGPDGSDLRKRQSRFYCDSNVTSQIGDDSGHVMLVFSNKRGEHSQILGFAGYLNNSGVVRVDRIYFEPGVPTHADDGYCRFLGSGSNTNDVVCGAVSVRNGTRSVAVVVFHNSATNH